MIASKLMYGYTCYQRECEDLEVIKTVLADGYEK